MSVDVASAFFRGLNYPSCWLWGGGVISLPARSSKEQESTREKLKLRYDMKHIENDHSIVIKAVKIQEVQKSTV